MNLNLIVYLSSILLAMVNYIQLDIKNLSYNSHIATIPPSIQQRMQQYTWHPGCPVPLSDLRYLQIYYWGYDNKAHIGELIINKVLAREVIEIFQNLYLAKFPIESMKLMDDFQGNDESSMAVNNTSAFNCRSITGKPGVFSNHSYGYAIDINPLINPYVKGNIVLPPNGVQFVDRSILYPGIITANSLIYDLFIQHGWTWGGNWVMPKDYQHFEKKPILPAAQ